MTGKCETRLEWVKIGSIQEAKDGRFTAGIGWHPTDPIYLAKVQIDSEDGDSCKISRVEMRDEANAMGWCEAMHGQWKAES